MRQAYKHLKAIGLLGDVKEMLQAMGLSEDAEDKGLILASNVEKLMKLFLKAMKQHRTWSKEEKAKKIAA